MATSGTTALPATATRELRLRLQAADGEYVALDERSLPSNVYDVTSMLRMETAPRSSWRDVAAAYSRAGDMQSAVQVLEQASADDVDSMLGDALTDSCSRTDLLAALAGAYIMIAEAQGTQSSERLELLEKAKNVLARADLIDTDQPPIWIAKGAAEAAAGRVDDAKIWFENAQQNGSIPGALGLAAILLNGTATTNPDPSRASSLLVEALRAAPCPAGTWTELGHALFRVSNLKQARIVLRRAVKATQASPPLERLEALYALARAESVDPSPASLQSAMAALREAYVRCGGHSDPRVLALLAEIHYLAGDPESACTYASGAVECLDELPSQALAPQYLHISRNLRAYALFERARALLDLGRYSDAMLDLETAKSAIEEVPNGASASRHFPFTPGLYLRLGMLKLSSGSPEDERVAEECFEMVLSEYDERCALAMRGLGTLLGRRVIDNLRSGRPRGGERFQRARELLKKGITADDAGRRDVPAMLVYSALIEEMDPSTALSMMEKAVAVMQEMNDHVPVEVHSNTVALLARVGRIKEARELERCKLDPDLVNANLDLMYNSARLAEMDKDVDAAALKYESILAKDPEYHEARIRLGYIAATRDRDYPRAEDHYKYVITSKSRCSMVAVAFLNKMYAITKNPRAQQELLEAHRTESDYMGIAFAQFMHSHLDGVGTSDRRHRFMLNHIAMPLQQILKHNKRNAFAANGIGVLFAEKHMMVDARDAFAAAGCCPEAARASRVNLAHATLSLAKAAVRKQNEGAPPGIHYTTAKVPNARALCEQAEKLYSDAADELSLIDNTVDLGVLYEKLELLLYRANAKYEIGAYREAANLLEKIVHYAPESASSWFNLGQVLRECASDRILRSNQNLEEMLVAKSELEASRASMLKAAQLDRGVPDRISRTRVDRKFLDHHTKFIQQVIRSHEVSLVNARNEAEDREKLRQEKQAEIDEENRRKEEENRRKELERQKRQEELERQAAEAAEKLRQTEEMSRLESARNRKTVTEDDEEVEEDVEYEDDSEDSIVRVAEPSARRRAKRDISSSHGENSEKRRRISSSDHSGDD